MILRRPEGPDHRLLRPKVRGSLEWLENRPQGRLFFVLAGFLIACPSLVCIIATAVRYLYAGDLSDAAAALRFAAFGSLYATGVYLACFAWKHFDGKKAGVLTLIVLIFTSVAVVIAAKAIALLSGGLGFELRSGSDSKDSQSRRSGGDPLLTGWSLPGGGSSPDFGHSGRRSGRRQDLRNAGCPGCGMPAGNGPSGLCPRCTAGWPY